MKPTGSNGGSSGQGLSQDIRLSMEQSLGADFSGVRIHRGFPPGTGSLHAKASGAESYTIGQDVYFQSPHFSPHSENGNALLAHELAHVVQQGGTTR